MENIILLELPHVGPFYKVQKDATTFNWPEVNLEGES